MPVYGQLELTRRAISAIHRHTPADLELIVIDDHGPQRLGEADLTDWLGSDRPWRLVRHDANLGFVASVNQLFGLAGRSDVVVINSDVEVLPGWFEGLASVIDTAGDVASVSSLATEGGLLSVPELAGLADPGDLLRSVRAAVGQSAEIPVAVAHCTWFSRTALDAVGEFDRKFDPGYGEEVDWSLRAARHGLVHLAALHSFVRHEGGASFQPRSGFWTLARKHELRLLLRYPVRWLAIRRFANDENTEFARSMRRIRQLLRTS